MNEPIDLAGITIKPQIGLGGFRELWLSAETDSGRKIEMAASMGGGALLYLSIEQEDGPIIRATLDTSEILRLWVGAILASEKQEAEVGA